MQRTLALLSVSAFVLSGIAAVTGPAVAARGDGGRPGGNADGGAVKLVHAQDVHPDDCTDEAWRFLIDHLDRDREAPARINVTWADETVSSMPLHKRAGSTAHYRSTRNLHMDVLDASTEIHATWDEDEGHFHLTEGPCLPDNQRPRVDFTWTPSDPRTGTTVPFTADVHDPDGNVTAWEWRFPDGSVQTGPEASHAFADDGDWNVTLNVTDDDGATNKTRRTVHVLNRAPLADAGGDRHVPDHDGSGNETVDLDATASTDPDGNVTAYEWTRNGTRIAETATPSVVLPVGDHALQLTATDDDGARATDTVHVSVAPNRPPTVAVAANATTVPTRVTVAFEADASDPDGAVANVTWRFDDGTTANGTTATHRFADDGTYRVVATARDDGNGTAAANVTIQVRNRAPTASVHRDPAEPVAGRPVRWTAEAADPDGTVASHRWSFGNGTSATGETVNHTFASPGNHTVRLDVTDDDGASTHVTRNVTVQAAHPPRVEDRTGEATTGDDLVIVAAVDAAVPLDRVEATISFGFADGNASANRTIALRSDGGTWNATVAVPDNATRIASNVTAVDADGRTGGSGWAARDVADDEAPDVTLDVASGPLEAGEDLEVAAHVGDNVGLEDARLVVDNPTGVLVDRRLDPGTVRVVLQAVDIGTYRVRLTAEDAAGNRETRRASVPVLRTRHTQVTLGPNSTAPVLEDRTGGLSYTTANGSARISVTARFTVHPDALGVAPVDRTTFDGIADRAVAALEVHAGPDHDATNVSRINVTFRTDTGAAAWVDPADAAVLYWNGTRWVDVAGYVGATIPGGGPHVFAAGSDPDAGVAWAVVDHTSTYALGGPTEDTDPTIADPSPTGSTRDRTARVGARIDDGGSGIDADGTILTLDGRRVPATIEGGRITYHTGRLADGTHDVTVEAVDRAGNRATRSWTFRVVRAGSGGGGGGGGGDGGPAPAPAVRHVQAEASPVDEGTLHRVELADPGGLPRIVVAFPDASGIRNVTVDPPSGTTSLEIDVTVGPRPAPAGTAVRDCLRVEARRTTDLRAGVPVDGTLHYRWNGSGPDRVSFVSQDHPGPLGPVAARGGILELDLRPEWVCMGRDVAPPRIDRFDVNRSQGGLDVRFEGSDNRGIAEVVTWVGGWTAVGYDASGTLRIPARVVPAGPAVIDVTVRDLSGRSVTVSRAVLTGWEPAAATTGPVPGASPEAPARETAPGRTVAGLPSVAATAVVLGVVLLVRRRW